MSEVPTVQPGQTWAPTRAGSRAKARTFHLVGPRWLLYTQPGRMNRRMKVVSFPRWVRSCDARVVVTP